MIISMIKKINKNRLIKLARSFAGQKILVIGDLIVDKYLWCAVDRISPEAPVPVALVKNESCVLGGAANVANNLACLGANVSLVGLYGMDSAGDWLNQELRKKGIIVGGLFLDELRSTIVKQRIMGGVQQLIRVDYEQAEKINLKLEKKILKYVADALDTFKILIFSDYDKGLISSRLAKTIIKLAKQKKVRVLADPTPGTFKKFRDVFLIKPNKKEAESIAGLKFLPDYSNLEKVGGKIMKDLRAKLVITLGKDGVAVFDGVNVFRLTAFAKEVYDVSGAGDTFIAALALGLASGASVAEGTAIGNYCAGVAVGKIGTATCSLNELLAVLGN